MSPPRGLSAEEAAAWARLAMTVTPIEGKIPLGPPLQGEVAACKADGGVSPSRKGDTPPPPRLRRGGPPPPPGENRGTANQGLDSHWERRLRAGTLAPDFTLDLHDHSLDAAYNRLLGWLDLAREAGARVALVIAGRERLGPAADRSSRRGAIRAKLLDWLAASRHSGTIAAIRKAHPRHGGEGALYVILKKPR